MNCQMYERIVVDLERVRPIPASLRDEAMVHSRECESCAMRLQDQRALTLALRTVAEQTQLAEAPVHVEERLLTSFRERKRQTVAAPVKHHWTYGAVAAAAMFVIIAGTVALVRLWTPRLGGQSKSAETAGLNNVQARSPIQQPVPTPPSPKPKVAGPKLNRRSTSGTSPLSAQAKIRRSSVQQSLTANGASAGYEIATEFLPVSYRNPMNLQDGGRIVRVELPRSVMARFGLPINMDRANERVKADLLLGIDGLTQAIRFVQ